LSISRKILSQFLQHTQLIPASSQINPIQHVLFTTQLRDNNQMFLRKLRFLLTAPS
jgi:hypothetical protein